MNFMHARRMKLMIPKKSRPDLSPGGFGMILNQVS